MKKILIKIFICSLISSLVLWIMFSGDERQLPALVIGGWIGAGIMLIIIAIIRRGLK